MPVGTTERGGLRAEEGYQLVSWADVGAGPLKVAGNKVMTGQSSDEKFRLTYEACQKIYIHDLLEILVGHVFCCKCHLSPEWRVGRLSAACRWMRCFLAGQSCSADRGQRIYTHITAHNSPIRKNTRFTWKIPTLRGSPSHIYIYTYIPTQAHNLVLFCFPPSTPSSPQRKNGRTAVATLPFGHLFGGLWPPKTPGVWHLN